MTFITSPILLQNLENIQISDRNDAMVIETTIDGGGELILATGDSIAKSMLVEEP
jgi:hypothetical protein